MDGLKRERGMARTAKNSHVESRTARSKLSSRREPYWTTLGAGCHVGYRRTAKGAGTWIGKFRDESGVRRYESLGAADDIRDADGLSALSFRQAQERARGWFEKKARELAGETVQMEPYAVADAMRDYLGWYKAADPGARAFGGAPITDVYSSISVA
jgi:hypothetical protein